LREGWFMIDYSKDILMCFVEYSIIHIFLIMIPVNDHFYMPVIIVQKSKKSKLPQLNEKNIISCAEGNHCV
jgi:hypothetical protein